MKTNLLVTFVLAGCTLALSLAAKYANENGYIDNDTMLRVVAMNGLMVAWFGNMMPKAIAPSAYARQITRFAGWTLVIGGLIYAGMWAFAPLPLAKTIGTGALAVAVILTVGYCLWLRGRRTEA